MQRVTAGAGDIARCMRARCPIVRGIVLMAAKALRILLKRRGGGLGSKIDHARERSTARFHMSASRPVAGLALQLTVAKRPMRVIGTRMLGAKNSRYRRIAVAAEAGIRALVAIRRFGGRVIGGESVMHHAAPEQDEGSGNACARNSPHLVRRGGNLVHNLHVRNAARPVTHAAGFDVGRIGA